MEHFAQDLRYALRQVGRAPATFASAALLIALGVAANTLVFALIDAVVLRTLPVREPENLVQLFELHPPLPARPFFRSALLRLIRERSSTVTDVVGQGENTVPVEHGGTRDRAHPHAVTNNYFSALGVSATLGRVIAEDDGPVAVLSHAYWTRSFGADPNVAGQTIHLFDRPFTIIGVASRDFVGTVIDSSADLWVPKRSSLNISDDSANRVDETYMEDSFTEILGRTRPGVTIAQAQAELGVLFEHFEQDWVRRHPAEPAFLAKGQLEVRSIARGTSPLRMQASTALWLLLAGTGLVLLMVCANVGGLLLARANAREKETALRLAIGAGRGRIARMWVMESLVLAVTGGLAGTLAAYAGMPLVPGWLPPARGIGNDPAEIRLRVLDLHPDPRVVAFGFALCLIVALVASLAPAWRSSRRDPWTALKTGMSDARHRRFQSALCAIQVAICAVLLVFAGWMVRSLSALRYADMGFSSESVAVFTLDPGGARYTAETIKLFKRRLIDGARALPGVESAAISARGLMRGIGFVTIVVFPDRPAEGTINTSSNTVTPGYFDTMGMRFVAGHDFDSASADRKPAPAVVNQEFVRRFFQKREPIGQVFGMGRKRTAPQFEIIGVVNDTKYRSLREIPPPIFYTTVFGPYEPVSTFMLQVRTKGDPKAVIPAVRQVAASIDPRVPVYEVTALREEIDRSLWQERMLVAMATAFGAFAMLVTAIGLYGILAYFMVTRKREIGLRVALGARPVDVARFLMRPLLATVGIGLALGGALAFAAGRWAQNLFYGVGPLDALSIGVALTLVAAVTFVAAAPPGLRAIRVAPALTLREE